MNFYICHYWNQSSVSLFDYYSGAKRIAPTPGFNRSNECLHRFFDARCVQRR